MNANIHPILKQLYELGCGDLRAAPVAFAVYMDLAEVKTVWDLQYHFCEDLDVIYLTCRENEANPKPNVYIPLPTSQAVSPEWIQRVQEKLPTENRGFILACKDADSTIVYYYMSEGLVTPETPEMVHIKKTCEDKQKLVQTELWRKRNLLYETAKSNSKIEEDHDTSEV